jgi:hypothetical protein
MMREEKPKIPATQEEAMVLLKRVDKQNPSSTDIEALRGMLQQHPQIWRETGDLLTQARNSYVAMLSPTVLRRETITLAAEELQKDLAHENDTALERLLIEQIVFCWLRLSVVEDQYSKVVRKCHSEASGRYWERRLSAAHKRHLSACESLARVRKLLRPSLRMNVAIVNPPPQM